ncbi:hypothetical protein CesoFtcFv8_020636 [Champsocephalus esox]|uniref:Uncharacterized protein n=1 Tax=Champsocephalus esox TaxID=159716 RepID=A0AAN8BBU7_9TELE|nr:hypothetical protein CesoFtcFv8_020636 [Champsocephalus esox]
MSRRKQGKPQHLSKRDFSPAEPLSAAVILSEELSERSSEHSESSSANGHPPLGTSVGRLSRLGHGPPQPPLSGAGPADLRPVPSHLPPGRHPALHRAQEEAMPRTTLSPRGSGAGQAPLALPRPGPHPVARIWLPAQPEARGGGGPGHAGRR